MRKKRQLSKREVQRLIKPVVSDLIQKIHNESSVLDERSKILSDLSRRLRRNGGEKPQSTIDPRKKVGNCS